MHGKLGRFETEIALPRIVQISEKPFWIDDRDVVERVFGNRAKQRILRANRGRT